MLQKIKFKAVRNLLSIPGWTTNRKIVVIESDDWGSIRMSSKSVYDKLFKAGIPVDKDPYCKYDSLASEDDLSALFETLIKFKDKNGNHPLITANTVVANPDFDKIKRSNFENYDYELFTETLSRYPKHTNSFKLWEQGIESRLFLPQFHAREHLNVSFWLEALQNGNKDLILAFNESIFGIPISAAENKRGNYMAALEYKNEKHLNEIIEISIDGLNLFKSIFNYNSTSMIAPCYIWPKEIESKLSEVGIKGFQGISYQYEPKPDHSHSKKTFHYIGQKNSLNQRYLVRNAFFEPTHFPDIDYTKEIIDRMKISFFWNKPVILSSHRLNFIGSIIEQNRTTNLVKFKNLLTAILSNWPDVEFISSSELIDLMNHS